MMHNSASPPPRRFGAAAFSVFLLSLLVLPAAAHAHAILVESQPPISGTVASGQVVFRLRYNSRIDHARSRLTLNLPDKRQTVLATPASDAVDILSGTAELAPGRYTLRWQVLAVDGHITRGDVPFTVDSAAGPSPSVTAR